ncbi:MAG TPA: WD40 repeat domain-containing protein [Solirubrobacteraceae bacterium]
MNDERLVEALRSLPTPDAAAAARRASDLVLAAHAGRLRTGRRRRRWVATVLASVIAVGGTLTAVQGAAVARWVRDTLRSAGHPSAQPAGLAALPGGGRLLVSTGRDAWVVGQGLTRAVAHTPGASVAWSAFGNYVACACGQTLDAVALNGRIAWIEHFAEPVRAPVWSPDGNRIAFAVGHELYVTAGDGTGVRALRAGGHSTALLGLAAWRPGPGHELAVHNLDGRVSLIDTDTDTYVAQIAIGPRAVSLSWSGNGHRLLVASAQTLAVYNAAGHLITERRAPRATTIRAARLAPSGQQIGLLLTKARGGQEALLTSVARPHASRVLLVGGSLGDLLFSPDGRWLLVGWHELDSWMFFTTAARHTQIRQVTHVAAQLAHSEPAVIAWCCTQPPPA